MSAPSGPTGLTPAAAPTGSLVIDLGETAATNAEEAPAARKHATRESAGGAGGGLPGCGLPGSRAASCGPVWLRPPGLLSTVEGTLSSVAVGLSSTATAASGNDENPGGSAGGGRPMTPTPGPAPGGASGGAASGGSGVGLAGFLAFAALLLLAAPRAMRRLRLACQPWLTAFFVLIPERPG